MVRQHHVKSQPAHTSETQASKYCKTRNAFRYISDIHDKPKDIKWENSNKIFVVSHKGIVTTAPPSTYMVSRQAKYKRSLNCFLFSNHIAPILFLIIPSTGAKLRNVLSVAGGAFQHGTFGDSILRCAMVKSQLNPFIPHTITPGVPGHLLHSRNPMNARRLIRQ